MGMEKARDTIKNGKAALGIEFGSTRIKAVLIDENNMPIASGGYGWENEQIDGIWTYSLDNVWKGIQAAYADMAGDAKQKYGVDIEMLAAFGLSGMMHGYMVFDKNDNLLTPFRTWRNNITQKASSELTQLFNYPIPQRWSIAHLYHCILNGDAHVADISLITSMAGYVHYKLTGEKVLGVGEASGVFPIDIKAQNYSERMLNQFDDKVSDKKFSWRMGEILPKVLYAGQNAGVLTDDGARLLDPKGRLKAGIAMCPPEGDAGTGMVATNCVSERIANVSAGTSVFACVVLENDLSKVHPEIDLLTTPDGKFVALVHSNNCTSDLNAWVDIFEESIKALGFECSKDKLFKTLYNIALTGDADCGGLLSYAYISGEHMTHFEEGRPLFVRSSNSNFNLANFMRVHLFTALGALRIGLDILFKQENVKVDEMLGHGGLFKTEGVGQKIMAAAMNAPVTVMETAGEGGAWGIGILASYMVNKTEDENLKDFLNNKVFMGQKSKTIAPDESDVAGYNAFMERYKQGLDIERAAVNCLD